ncbi:hypothetical protein J7K19_02540 [bacterium]|nr:hypothetical protein [bacterium]
MKREVIVTVVAILVGAVTYPTLAQTPQNIAVTNQNTVHIITWTDQANLSGETYNVYVSQVPITDLNFSSAYLIGTQIPEGQQSYEYQLFTPFESRLVIYYYAVTSTVAGIENTTIIPGKNATTVGEDGTTTWGAPMIWFGKGGFPPPVCDGEIDEWGFFNIIYLDPTSPVNKITSGEISDAADLSGYLWCGADEEALYFAADITDDYLENTYPFDVGDMWKGDAVEFFLGLYDLRPSDPRHEDYGFTSEPDFQILIKANAGTDPCFHVYTNGKRTPGDMGITGTEQWCGPRIPGDLTSGYYIEAKLPYESLNWDPALPPVPHPKIGWVLPCNIMIDDTDTPGGVDREGQLSWSNHDDAGASWDRPDVWKHQVVIYALTPGPPPPPPLEIPTDINVINNQTVHTITWHDVEGLTGETYNVYMSESPITDVKADGVFLIGTEIAEGEGSYEYQLYTPLQPGGDDVTYYYAVTSVVGGVENTLIKPGINATIVGESGITTWGLAAIWFDDIHISVPACDGDLSEWPEQLSVYLEPHDTDPIITTTIISPTVNGYFWCGVDEEALYFAANVTDDYLENIYSYDNGNMWKGDSPEYYLGLYDMRPSDPRHQDYQATAEPDFQIDIKANAGTEPCFHVYTNGKRTPGDIGITGTAQWCGPRIPGDLTSGYYIEAKLPYERLNWDPALPPVPHPKIGWVLPCNIMVNDCDTPGGPYREGQISWSDDPDAGASWDRPDVWKHQVVIYDPTRLADCFQPVPTTLPTNIIVTNQNTVHVISWKDATALSGETYNVYVSQNPITDLNSPFVYLIGTQIPEGQQSYEYQLYTPNDPVTVTYYYAVTSVVNGVENTTLSPGINTTTDGEPGTTTWALAMVWLDGIKFHPPTFDGDLSDWVGYPRIYIDPTSPDNRITAGVIDGPQDLSGYFYYAADQNNLYFAADVTDDYLVNIWTADQGNVWKGDGVEFYLGLYDQRPSDPPHDDFQVQPEPDYQILIKANAGTGPAFHIYTNGKTTTEGNPTITEQWCGERIAGDPTSGWIVEAKLPYEALTWDPVAYPQVIRPAIGWVLPTNIGINDTDVPGLGERQGQLMWSNHDDAGASWDRPETWKHQVVIYDPKMFGPGFPPSIPTDISVNNNTTVHIITWTDADGLAGETYNVYMSESPITNVRADDVYLIGTGISENEGSYEYMLYTPGDPGDVTYYYAVTVVSNGVENTTIVPGVNATTSGEAGTTTWALPMVWMDGTVYPPPEFDGDLTEWESMVDRSYVVYLDPTSPENKITMGEIDGADDLSGYLWCGADKEALYFAADITDDYLENIYSYDDADMWKGDAVEFYLGLYDMRPSDQRHKDYEITTEPDFQIDIKANAGTNPCFHVYTNVKCTPGDIGITGTEQWCGPRIPGDLTSGYYIEAKLPYERLNWDPVLPSVPHPKIGWVLPCNIMVNDCDTPGGPYREGQISWSDDPDAGASWDRPDVWKHQVVIYDPTRLADCFQPVPTTLPTNIIVTNQNTVHVISWKDATALSGETYNVYVSQNPITDLNSPFVYLIGTQIPEGQQSYEYQLYTPNDPVTVTYYYAVTSVVNGVENTTLSPGINTTTDGEPGTTTWALAMVWLDGIKFHPPTFDGDLSDWVGYPRIYIDPTSPDNRITAGVIDGPQDLSGYFYYAADQNNLYFAADVTDDYLVNIWTADQGNVWKGDGVEFYLGLYDQRPSDPPHDDFQVQPEPDYQILIKANAGTGPAFHIYTNGKTTTEGNPTITEQWCGERIAGDPTSGWIVEAKLPYEALTWDPVAYPQVIRPAIGWVLPTNIGINDTDVPGLGERQGQLMWSNHDDAGASWDRPETWKHQVVIYDPKMFGPGFPPSIPTDISVNNNTTVHIITWTDADGLAGETYNVYMSESPITNVRADDVYLIGTGISENEGSYEYMLYTPGDPGDVTYYYAVTVVSNGVENTTIVPGVNATTSGEAGTTTWALPMVWMDGTVYPPPEFDGDLTEWESMVDRSYVVYLDPTSPENKITMGEIDGADDLSGYLWCGADKEALYFAADITDDYLENIYSYDDADMWKGDAVEFYLGLYDMRPSDQRHKDYEITTEPDFQILIKPNAGTNPCFHVYTNGKRNPSNIGIIGTEQWCGPRVPGDFTSGYYAEAKLPYSGLNWDPALPPVPHPQVGWVLPCNIMIRDNDTPGGSDQEGQLSWSNHQDAGASWDRPDIWKHQVVIYDPKLLHLVGKTTISYQIQIAAYSDVTNDLYNYAGVSPNATNGFDPGLDQPEPPPSPANYLQLYFPHPEWNHNLGERFCRDIRPNVDLSNAALVWNFVIETDLSNQTIAVCVRPEWDKIPPNYGLVLKDLDNDLFQNLRTDTSAYQYVSTATGGQHRFQLIVGNTSVTQSQKTLTAGWNLISLPLSPQDFSTNSILGDDITEAYYVMGFRQTTGYFPADTLQLGCGYWIGTTQAHNVDIEGEMLTEAVPVPLEKGYNLIGNPFPFSIYGENFIFVKNGRHLGAADAANEGWVQDVFYTFAAEDSGYREVSLFQAWQGAWIPVLEDSVELMLDPSAAMASKKIALRKEGGESISVSSWRFILTATTNRATDFLTQLGVDATATDGFDPNLDYCEPPPPPGGDYVEVYFPHPKWGALPGIRYNRDIRAPLQDEETKIWNLEIHTNNTGMVKLQWPDLSARVPDGHRFFLIDLDAESENSVNMQENQSYAYFSTGLRHFRIEVTYNANSVGEGGNSFVPTCFKLSQNYPNPFNPNTQIDYALPKASHVVIEIYNLAGQKIVTLVDGDVLPGSYSVCWNGQDRHGRAVASGVYLCRMHAKTLGSLPMEFTDRKKLILLK